MYQIMFMFLLLGVQMFFVLISLNVVHPGVTRSQMNNTQDTNNFFSIFSPMYHTSCCITSYSNATLNWSNYCE